MHGRWPIFMKEALRWAPLTCLSQEHVSPVTSLSLTPDGWTLLTAARDQTAALWDLRSHTKITTVPTFEAVEGACSDTLICYFYRHPLSGAALSGRACCKHASMPLCGRAACCT